jgi:biotin operon repressor
MNVIDVDIAPLFKALADEKRIKIAALITDRGLSVEEIASAVDLTPATVSHHLARLREAGLVTATHEQYYTVYRFNQQPLLDALRALAEQPARPDLAADLAKYDQKVLATYLVDGTLISIPTQRKKRDVILRFLAQQFEPGRTYGEKEVNVILAAFHDDVATLRRELVAENARLLRRENGRYRRVQ